MAEDTGELADQIAVAAASVPGVVALDGGAFGEVGTYRPTRRVCGVRVGEFGRVEIHIVVAYGSDVRGVADQVRDTVEPLVSEAVDVIVADIAAGDD